MIPTQLTAENRIDFYAILALWMGLLVGIAVSAVANDSPTRVVTAALVAGAFVAGVQSISRKTRSIPWVGELLSLVGAAAALVAISLTNGGDSPYLLLALMVTLFAANERGVRVALEIAALSTGGLILAAVALDQPVSGGSVLVAAGLHIVVALGFSQVRHQLNAAGRASEAAIAAHAVAEAEVTRLHAAHDLLMRLSTVADATQLSPVQAAKAAIASLTDTVTFDSCLVALAALDGPVVVARHGEEVHQHHLTTFPLAVSEREVGFVVISRNTDLDDGERAAVEQTLQPLALAFSNILMLQELAKRVVREERTRLARALHDDIGPSLASIGLGLDLAVLQYAPTPEMADHLNHLRTSISGLVEEIRSNVTDLRHEGRLSLVQRLRVLAAEAAGGGPRILVELDERRPPRPGIAGDLNAILTEAVRNAIHHSQAEAVRIEGFVDHDSGSVIVRDDGIGFDPDAEVGRHYGLVGMAERSAKSEVALKVDSAPGRGTTVSMDWGHA